MAAPRTTPTLAPGQRVPMSYEEYQVAVDESLHAEWVNGEVIVFMSPSSKHQQLMFWLGRLMAYFADLFDLGEVFVAPLEMRARPGGSAREPDIFFVARTHRDRLERQRLNGPADLIVEIISPESAIRDQVEKLHEYAASGVPEYWLIDSRRSPAPPAFYRLGPDGIYAPIAPDAEGRLHSIVLPGFWLDPAWLTQDPLPKPHILIRQIMPGTLRDDR